MSRSERRREAREGGSNMNKVYMLLAGIAVIGVGAVGLSVSGGSGGAATAPVAVEGLDDLERLVELAQGNTKGSESATITIIEFGDFQCPGCGGFATQVKPSMELAFVESGKAKFVFYDFPLVGMHPNAFFAARASRCAADQGKYWEYHDNLFRMQNRWSLLTDPADTFVDYAEALDLDGGAFRTCLLSDRHADVVTANMELGEQLGVNGTPTLFIEYGGSARRVPSDLQSISQYIDGILEASSEGGA